MAKVTIENLRKEYGEVLAVDNLNLLVEDGELVALLGPSGCGKTTTLRCIAGLEEPQDGHIYFDERDVTFEPPERKDVGIVFQNYALFPHMTIFQNIAFGLQMMKVAKREIKDPKSIVMKNGRPATQGECPVCGTKVYRIGKR